MTRNGDCAFVRPTMDSGFRCSKCGARWDRDDEAPPCPVATRAHDESLDRSNRYVSALAPAWKR